MTSIRKRLQGDEVIYKKIESDVVFAEQVVENLDNLIAMAVWELGIDIQDDAACVDASMNIIVTAVRSFIINDDPMSGLVQIHHRRVRQAKYTEVPRSLR